MMARGDKQLRHAALPNVLALEESLTQVLLAVGEDPTRDGLKETPSRWLRAIKEMTSGYDVDIKSLLATTFEDQCDEMVVVPGIRFASMCEHHLFPFFGTVCVGYLPSNGRVLGLSKIPRVVDAFARRLQVQERFTRQIAAAISDGAKAKGVGVIVQSQHCCMSCRGVRQSDATMVTSCLLGSFRRDASVKAEMLSLMK